MVEKTEKTDYLEYLACPVCCMTRPRVKTGRKAMEQKKIQPGDAVKGAVRFDKFDLDNSYLIQLRVGGGSLPLSVDDIEERQKGQVKGRGKTPGIGFRTVDGLTLSQIKDDPDYADIVEQLRNQCVEIIRLLNDD